MTLLPIQHRLQGHPHRKSLPGIETTSGPLGSGLSQAIGIALASKLDRKKYMVYCAMSDGELNCGNSWEAFMFAGKNKLRNLTAIIDRNNIQIDGFTEDIMPLEPLRGKFEAFNWHVIEANGHDFDDLDDAIVQAQEVFAKPTIIIANTIPGKGVDFMERDFRWHGNPPGKGPEDIVKKENQGKEALKKLRLLGDKIRS